MLDATCPTEKANVTKGTLVLLDEHYNHPNTSLLIFHFEPQLYPSSDARLKQTVVKHAAIEGKDLYLFDNFFLEAEGKEMQDFSRTAPFSRNSYGSPEAIERGEKPARSMNGKERWHFFAHPPQAIQEVYKLLGLFAHHLNADITTLPWELCNASGTGSPAVIANKLEEASEASMELGKHQDCNPAGGISYGIPKLYAQEEEYHAQQFESGAAGKPWMISLMVYTTEAAFSPDYCMGTVFYEHGGKTAMKVNCAHMRLVIFEGDIFHSIEQSKIPEGVKTWRISYVYKLIVNPRTENQSVKEAFLELVRSLAPGMESLPIGPDSRA